MFASAVYDSANNRMIVFGGTSTACGFPGNLATGVWVLSNANGLGGTLTWTQLSPTGSAPLDRLVHTAVYDPTNNRMIVFGGLAASGGLVNDVWVLSNANGLGGTPTWTQLTPGGAVTPIRDFHSAVYDPGTNKMIVFGGANIAATPANPCFYSNDVWVLSNANGLGGTPTWTQLAPTGGPPEQRAVHTAVFNSATNRMTIFGGGNCTPTGFSFALGDVWVLTDANGIVTVPFAAFAAKVEIELGPLANDDAFEVKAIFTLGAGSDGISPLTEDVHLQVGTFSTTIPAGSFKVDKKGRFKFEGIIGGVSLQAKITPRGANSFEFKAEGQGADLTGTANPVTLGLTIGDDSGSTTVTAEFE
jgi:hypothetical protein